LQKNLAQKKKGPNFSNTDNFEKKNKISSRIKFFAYKNFFQATICLFICFSAFFARDKQNKKNNTLQVCSSVIKLVYNLSLSSSSTNKRRKENGNNKKKEFKEGNKDRSFLNSKTRFPSFLQFCGKKKETKKKQLCFWKIEKEKHAIAK
jgi:hypothetical protein